MLNKLNLFLSPIAKIDGVLASNTFKTKFKVILKVKRVRNNFFLNFWYMHICNVMTMMRSTVKPLSRLVVDHFVARKQKKPALPLILCTGKQSSIEGSRLSKSHNIGM